MARRAVAWLTAVAVVLLPLLFLVAPEARACSCGRLSLEERVGLADVIFIGEQTRRTELQRRVVLEFSVHESFKGEVDDIVEVSTGFGDADCGVNTDGRGEVAIFAFFDRRDRLEVNICASVAPADLVRYHFAPLPEPTSGGATAFAVSHLLEDVRLTLLDSSGQVTGLIRGPGLSRALAFCPGGKKLVEIIEPDSTAADDVIGGDRTPAVQVIDLDSLEVEFAGVITISERESFGTNRALWVEDLECHAADGSLMTYLLPRWEWDSLSGANLMAPGAMVHIWESGEVRSISVADARAATVDPVARRAHVITGLSGQGLLTVDIDTGAAALERDLPGSSVGWEIELGPGGGTLGVLARSEPMERENWYFAEVTDLLVLDSDSGEILATADLRPARVAVDLLSSESGFVSLLSWTDRDQSELIHVSANGEVIERLVLEGWQWPSVHGLGSDVLLRRGDGELAGALVRQPADGTPPQKVEGIFAPQAIATAASAGLPFPPAGAGLTTASTTTAPATTTTATQSPTTVAALPRSAEHNGGTPWGAVLGTLGGVAVGALAVAHGATRRKKRPG